MRGVAKMNIEKGLISSSQLVFLVIGLLQGSTFTVAFIIEITKQDTWVVVLFSSFVILPMILVYLSLCKGLPGKNVIEMNEIIYGPSLGKLVSGIYIFYFWYIIAANIRYVGDFFTNYLFPETPIVAFFILFACTCAWAVRGGIEVIARCTPIIVFITVLIAVIITLFLVKYMRISNFMPVFTIGLREFIQGTHVMVTIPYGEMVVFLMIIPYMNSRSQARGSILLGFTLGAFYICGVILRNAAVLGILNSILVLPSYQTARLINVGEIITRMEILIAMIVLANEFIKTCIFYYSTVLALAQLIKLRSYKHLVIPTGIISVCAAGFMFSSSVEHAAYAANIYPIYATPVIFLLPTISLLLTNFRKLSKKVKRQDKQ